MRDAESALARAVDALVRRQEDGCFEGEMRWCPMLTAQYVLFHHALGVAIAEPRRQAILLHLRGAALADGTFGLHAHANTSLYVTTLVYVAARMLGERADASQPVRPGPERQLHAWGLPRAADRKRAAATGAR